MNAFVAQVNNSADISVGDVVRFESNGYYKNYSSFDMKQDLEVIEVGHGPTGKKIFKGIQKTDRYGRTRSTPLETPFLSTDFFKIIKKGSGVNGELKVEPTAKPIDTLILEEKSLKIERGCNGEDVKKHVDAILRKDMNKKLLVFKLASKVSVGELPIVWSET